MEGDGKAHGGLALAKMLFFANEARKAMPFSGSELDAMLAIYLGGLGSAKAIASRLCLWSGDVNFNALLRHVQEVLVKLEASGVLKRKRAGVGGGFGYCFSLAGLKRLEALLHQVPVGPGFAEAAEGAMANQNLVPFNKLADEHMGALFIEDDPHVAGRMDALERTLAISSRGSRDESGDKAEESPPAGE